MFPLWTKNQSCKMGWEGSKPLKPHQGKLVGRRGIWFSEKSSRPAGKFMGALKLPPSGKNTLPIPGPEVSDIAV